MDKKCIIDDVSFYRLGRGKIEFPGDERVKQKSREDHKSLKSGNTGI
ncbi:hypothetical protein GCWU000342_01451 [Shuttleworthella satelles DSM 14600]|uniref:Uncharacterized protein n=1 Tax=Shuttleworthella satelles DSM 14600 TaxID=626523 RepID=C4GAA6_9FIRM|nr:hypothetical protein GCWU000342_01451 [Shuttleworthia satelles DSM 14600]